jgi:magnesium chelatase subunit I
MSIANLENVVSNAERRGLLLKEPVVAVRVVDLPSILPSSRGKIELTMSEEDGQEDRIVPKLLAEAIKNVFESYFEVKSLKPLVDWFESGQTFAAGEKIPIADYVKRVAGVPKLIECVKSLLDKSGTSTTPENEAALIASAAEFVLEGLHVENRLNKNVKAGQTSYKR